MSTPTPDPPCALCRWIPVTERMPTEEDINAYGDVDWSDGKEIWEGLYSRNDKGATHWRRIVLP